MFPQDILQSSLLFSFFLRIPDQILPRFSFVLFIEKKCESNFTNIPNPGTEPRPLALQVNSLPAEPEGKPKNIGVGSLSLLQGIFLIQESNWGLLPCRLILYQLSSQGSPIQWIASLNYPKDWRIWTLCVHMKNWMVPIRNGVIRLTLKLARGKRASMGSRPILCIFGPLIFDWSRRGL